MAFPYVSVRVPAVLAGQRNGRLDPAILVATPGAARGPTVVLVRPAARSWRAMTVDAARHGHVLKASGPTDSYRPYSVQLSIFLDRYRTYNTGSGVSTVWNGRRWWKLPGVAAAAKPGTSNHGWGLAVDTGEERDGDTGTESMDAGTLNWLVANELRYGFSHEIQSEPWHIRYVAGDNIPPATLAYERSLTTTPPPTVPTQESEMYFLSAKSDPGVWFFEPGRRTLANDLTDRARLAAAAGIPNVVAEVSDGLFSALADGRTRHQ